MKELKVRGFILLEGETEPVPIESVSPERMKQCREKVKKRMSRILSDHFAQHMDEYARGK